MAERGSRRDVSTIPPSLPPKSPLRTLRSVSSMNGIHETVPGTPHTQSISAILESSGARTIPVHPATSAASTQIRSFPALPSSAPLKEELAKPYPRRPSSTSSARSMLTTSSRHDSPSHVIPRVDSSSSLGPSTASSGQSTPEHDLRVALARRRHALLELLSTERAYASDLALMRHIYIPLALGLPASIQIPVPEVFSASSVTHRESQRAPMTPEDVRIVFNNTEEIAVFADAFAERIERAISNILDDQADSDSEIQRRDTVGALFLDVVPIVKHLYTTCITRHPLAISRLEALMAPVSPDPSPAPSNSGSFGKASRSYGMTSEMRAYLAKTRALTERHTHAWDLPSLLIKPVQRLLKYPLLLQSIIQSTERTIPDHPDLPSLIRAKDVMETVARDVNEARRRWEIVHVVLASYGFGSTRRPSQATPSSPPSSDAHASGNAGTSLKSFARSLTNGKNVTKKPKNVGTGASKGAPAFVTEEVIQNPLTTIQSLKTKLKTQFVITSPSSPAVAEEIRIAITELTDWENRMKVAETTLRDFFKCLVVDWTRSVRGAFVALGTWGVRFCAVIDDLHPGTLPNAGNSDNAVKGFIELIKGLVVLWKDLDNALQAIMKPTLTLLLSSLSQPLILVRHCIALHPLHIQHLSTPYSKNRSPYLLSSSKTFLALQAQLRAEMPILLDLFDRGFAGTVLKASKVQARFWEECWTRWTTFALGVGVSGGGMNLPPGIAFQTTGREDEVGSSIPLAASGVTRDISNTSDREFEALRLFRERWDEVDSTINGLTIIKKFMGPRTSEASSLADLRLSAMRSSATSSLIAALSDDAIGSLTAPMPGFFNGPLMDDSRSRSDTTSSSKRLDRNNTVSSGSSGPSSDSSSRGTDGRLLTEKELQRERKRREKAEKAAVLKLVQGHTKAEKDRQKLEQKKQQIKELDLGSYPDIFLPCIGNEALARRRAQPTEERKREQLVEIPRRPDKGMRKGADEDNVAKRTKDILFGLQPHESEMIPSLPTLESLNPTSRSFPGSYPTQGRLSPIQLAHPYNSEHHDSRPHTPGSTSNGIWESLFDASQQTYVFHNQTEDGSARGGSMMSRTARSSGSSFGRIQSISYPESESFPSLSPPGENGHDLSPLSNQLERIPDDEQNGDPDPPVPEHETLYIVSCVHPFQPPDGVTHLDLPFLSLDVGDVVDILLEDGHPSTHENLPIYVDEGDDCMLVGRDEQDRIGWCLASFVMPLI